MHPAPNPDPRDDGPPVDEDEADDILYQQEHPDESFCEPDDGWNDPPSPQESTPSPQTAPPTAQETGTQSSVVEPPGPPSTPPSDGEQTTELNPADFHDTSLWVPSTAPTAGRFLLGGPTRAIRALGGVTPPATVPGTDYGVTSVNLGYGQGGAGKSIAALGACVRAAAHGVRSLYFALENGDGVHDQLEASLQFYEVPGHGKLTEQEASRIWVVTEQTPDFIRKPEESVRLIEQTWKDRGWGAHLIVFDTLSKLLLSSCSENDDDAARSIMTSLRRLAASFQAAVVFLHHTNKGGQTWSGSHVYSDDADSVQRIARGKTPGTSAVRWDKRKRGALPPDSAFQVKTVHVTPPGASKPIESAYIIPLASAPETHEDTAPTGATSRQRRRGKQREPAVKRPQTVEDWVMWRLLHLGATSVKDAAAPYSISKGKREFNGAGGSDRIKQALATLVSAEKVKVTDNNKFYAPTGAEEEKT